MNRKETEVMVEKWNSYGENSICKMEASEKEKVWKLRMKCGMKSYMNKRSEWEGKKENEWIKKKVQKKMAVKKKTWHQEKAGRKRNKSSFGKRKESLPYT